MDLKNQIKKISDQTIKNVIVISLISCITLCLSPGCKKNEKKKLSPNEDINVILSIEMLYNLGKENFDQKSMVKSIKRINPYIEDIKFQQDPYELIITFHTRTEQGIFKQTLITNPSVLYKTRDVSRKSPISDFNITGWLSASIDSIERMSALIEDDITYLKITFKSIASSVVTDQQISETKTIKEHPQKEVQPKPPKQDKELMDSATTKERSIKESNLKEKPSDQEKEKKSVTISQPERKGIIVEGSIFKTIKRGGPIMFIIILCSIVGLCLIFERAFKLRESKLIPRPFVAQIHNVLNTKDIRKALSICEQNDAPIARVLKSGLISADQGISSFKTAIESAGAYEAAVMEQHLGILGVLANVAPLLGLLGTVTGMIKAFDTIAITGAGRPELLATGIAEALITTAGGLMVGIPLLIFFHYFQGKIENILIEMEDISLGVLEKISFKTNINNLREELADETIAVSRPHNDYETKKSDKPPITVPPQQAATQELKTAPAGLEEVLVPKEPPEDIHIDEFEPAQQEDPKTIEQKKQAEEDYIGAPIDELFETGSVSASEIMDEEIPEPGSDKDIASDLIDKT